MLHSFCHEGLSGAYLLAYSYLPEGLLEACSELREGQIVFLEFSKLGLPSTLGLYAILLFISEVLYQLFTKYLRTHPAVLPVPPI